MIISGLGYRDSEFRRYTDLYFHNEAATTAWSEWVEQNSVWIYHLFLPLSLSLYKYIYRTVAWRVIVPSLNKYVESPAAISSTCLQLRWRINLDAWTLERWFRVLKLVGDLWVALHATRSFRRSAEQHFVQLYRRSFNQQMEHERQSRADHVISEGEAHLQEHSSIEYSVYGIVSWCCQLV